jgi:N-acetylneuraminic acid mutarotase
MNRATVRPIARCALLAVVASLLGLWAPSMTAQAAAVTLMVSSSPNRAGAVALAGTTRSGNLYIFTTPDSGVAKVTFWLDDPQRSGAARQIETWAPFDFRGGSSAANPWDSGSVANGQHTITVQVVANDQSLTVVSATFTVSNGGTVSYAPQVSASSTRSAPYPLAGAALKGDAYVFVPAVVGVTKVSFWLDDVARAHPARHVETSAAWDFVGTATGGGAMPWATSGLADGAHVLSVDVQAGSSVTHLDTSFTVANASLPGTRFTYTPIARMPIGTTEAESTVLNGKLYLFGGFDVTHALLNSTTRAWVYDPATNVWSSLPPMPAGGIDHAGIDSDGARFIYYAAGFGVDPTSTDQLLGQDLVWRYDTVNATYQALPSLPAPRFGGALAYVSGWIYYISGGNQDHSQDSGAVWALDVANGATAWVARAPMPNPRNHLGWSVIGGKIYVAGGQHLWDSSTAQSELDSYDPLTDAWTTLAPLPVARSHTMDSSFVLNGRLVVAGGWTTKVVSGAVTAYDPATNTWQSLSDLPEPRTSTTARSISGGRFLFCCGSASSSTATGWIAVPTP